MMIRWKSEIKRIVAISIAVATITINNELVTTYAATKSDAMYFVATYNGDGADVYTQSIKKKNNSATVVYNKFSSCDVYVRVNKNSNDTSGFVLCGSKEEVFINTKYTKGDSVYLQLSPATDKKTSISGYWNPDNVGSLKTVNYK